MCVPFILKHLEILLNLALENFQGYNLKIKPLPLPLSRKQVMNQVSVLKLEGHLSAFPGSMELSYSADSLQRSAEGAAYFPPMTSPFSLRWAKNDPETQVSKSLFPERIKKNTFVIIKKATLKLSVIKFSYLKTWYRLKKITF